MEQFDTTDPRDRMFAMYNIAASMENGRRRGFPKVDYTEDVATTCIKLTKYIIRTEQTAVFLTNAGSSRHGLAGLPSWAVDFTKRLSDNFAVNTAETTPYKAAGSSTAILVCGDDDDSDAKEVLATSSFRCMRVARVGTTVDNRDSRPSGFQHWAELAADMGDLYPGSQHTGVAAYVRTLIGDHPLNLDPYPVTDQYLACVAMLIVTLIKTEHPEESEMTEDPVWEGLYDLVFETADRRQAFETYSADAMQRLITHTSHRCFFVTECGHFGLGPTQVRAGDEIHIISGGSAPFLLRRSDDESIDGAEVRHTLLGTAYVHGIMYGETLSRDDFEWDELFLV
jgi:hypothetical protein